MKKVFIADNQFFETDEVLDAIEKSFKKNLVLSHYDFKNNFIGEDGVNRICDILEETPHVSKVEVSERISKETYERFCDCIKNNAPKKGKKKKGKKAKK